MRLKLSLGIRSDEAHEMLADVMRGTKFESLELDCRTDLDAVFVQKLTGRSSSSLNKLVVEIPEYDQLQSILPSIPTRLTRLSILDLDMDPGVDTLGDKLRTMVNLHSLAITYNGYADFSFLTALPKLRSLSLYHNFGEEPAEMDDIYETIKVKLSDLETRLKSLGLTRVKLINGNFFPTRRPYLFESLLICSTCKELGIEFRFEAMYGRLASGV